MVESADWLHWGRREGWTGLTGMISLGQSVSLGWGRQRVACDGPEGHIGYTGVWFDGLDCGTGRKGGLVTLGEKGRGWFHWVVGQKGRGQLYRLVSLGQARRTNWLDWDGFIQTAG